MTEMTQEYRDSILRRLVGKVKEREEGDPKDARDPRDGEGRDEGGRDGASPSSEGDEGEVVISGENLAEPVKVAVNLPSNKGGKRRS